MRKGIKKLISRMGAFALAFSISFSSPLSVLATEFDSTTSLLEIESSVGSDVSDVTNTTPIGEDKVQGQTTNYYEETEGVLDEEKTMDTTVYVTQASSFSITIPKTIILDGQEKEAKYVVGVKGDLSGKGFVYVLPQSSFWMYENVNIKQPQKAYVTQDKIMFVSTSLDTIPANAVNGVNSDTYVTTEGTIKCAGITAGSWNGNFMFNIASFGDFENPPAIASDGTILELTSSSMYIGANYKGIKNSNVNVIEAVDEEAQASPMVYTLKKAVGLNTNNIVYESDNENILVNEDGGVYLSDNAQVGDTATITATYKGVVSDTPGVNDREDISVDFQVTVFDIILSTNELELSTGEQGSVTANVYPQTIANELPLTWEKPQMMDGVNFNVENNTLMNIDVTKTAIDDNNGVLTASVEDYGQSCRLVILPNHEHEYAITEQIPASCTAMGKTTYTCSICDANVEGHSYFVNEPQLEHIVTDGHFCDLCDQLIVPYRVGDLIKRTVAGKELYFVCADEDYVDQSGNKGAYFLSVTALYGENYNDSNDISWANSKARKTLNGTNSDTTHIMKTNTTVVEYADGVIANGANVNLSHFTFTPTTKFATTEDYYFLPSIRELCEYSLRYYWPFGKAHLNENAWDADGKSTKHDSSIYYNVFGKVDYDDFFNDPDKDGMAVFTFRTPANDKYINFFYSDGTVLTSNTPTAWQQGYEDLRVACVIEQDIDSFGGATEVKGYKKGDVVYQTVAGKKIKFACVDPDYVDASGKDIGALFLSTEIIGANDCLFDKESNIWATSDLRAYLNGPNSVTDGLVLANTTVKTEGLKGYMNWYSMYGHEYQLTPLTPTIETYDYFFELSVEEMNDYNDFMLSSTGQIRDMNKHWGDDKYGFYLRTPATGTTNRAYYVYSDAKYYNILNAFSIHEGIIGSRPACVLPN